MRTKLKKSLCLALLVTSCSSLAVAPYYSIRSQGENSARELVGAGWNTQINLCDMCERYSAFSVTAEYSRSFKPRNICDCLFGPNNCCTALCNSSCNDNCCYDNCSNDCYRIAISGTQAENRGECDWLADYFGLPTDFKSIVTFEPRITNFLVDFNLYVGLDQWVQGAYFRIHAPVCRTRWDLNMCESVETTGTNNHWSGYFSTAAIDRTNLVNDFASFASGCSVLKDESTVDNASKILFNNLSNAKMDCSAHTKTALADLQCACGYNFVCCPDYRFGLNVRVAAPTGNRPEGRYLFEPIVGNGKHWELGGGLSAQYTFWQNECEARCMTAFFDVNVTHLFGTKQCRTFDLCCKPLSRYMLAAQMKKVISGTLRTPSGGETPIAQFAGIYSPVANLTTMPVDVSVSAQADLTLMLQYDWCNYSFDLGYNFWGRSCEKIKQRCDCRPSFEEETWVLKGDAFMYGFTGAGIGTAVALSASQSKATICKGTNNWPDGATINTADLLWAQNPGIDNPGRAYSGTDDLDVFTTSAQSAYGDIYTSLDPIFISFNDIDFCGARTKGYSHSLFAHFEYTFSDYCYCPYLGVGGQVEFGCSCCDDNCTTQLCCNSCDDTCASACNPCKNYSGACCSSCSMCCSNDCCQCCAVSQWGLWLKGGVAFN